jgi:hypothetical protein
LGVFLYFLGEKPWGQFCIFWGRFCLFWGEKSGGNFVFFGGIFVIFWGVLFLVGSFLILLFFFYSDFDFKSYLKFLEQNIFLRNVFLALIKSKKIISIR